MISKQTAKTLFMPNAFTNNMPHCSLQFPPQVLIFAEKKQDVDAIHEYLLLKGVEAVAIHGGKGVYIYILFTSESCSHLF